MDTLKNILKNVLYGYIRKGINGSTELTRNVDETLFTLIASGKSGEKRFTFTALIVIIIADKIVIISPWLMRLCKPVSPANRLS